MNNTRNQLKGITIKVNVGGNGLKETTVVTNQGVAAKVVKLERPTVTQPAVKEEAIEKVETVMGPTCASEVLIPHFNIPVVHQEEQHIVVPKARPRKKAKKNAFVRMMKRMMK